jgi:hypothetical protein
LSTRIRERGGRQKRAFIRFFVPLYSFFARESLGAICQNVEPAPAQAGGYWHTIYLRFKRGADRGLWWNILFQLQRQKRVKAAVVIADSTTISFHRHGGGLKGGSKAKASASAASRQNFTSP